MKITITENGQAKSYDVDFDWSFDEADIVKQVTGVRVGEMLGELLRGDVMAHLALAIVGKMRVEPGFDPWSMKQRKVESIDFDLETLIKETTEGPPAKAGEKPAAERGGKQSPRKS